MVKKVPVLFCIAITVFFLFTANTPSYSQGTSFTILHFNDSHSNIIGSGPKNVAGEYTKGGIDRAASVIKSSRLSDTNVMVFHIGDFSTGSFYYNTYFGTPELTIMKRLNFDAVTIGNHEFDLGPSVLYSSLLASFLPGSMPVLSANLNLNGFPALNSYITPYNIKTIEGVKIGIFGLTINDPSSNPSPVVISDSILQITQATVSTLQASGCNVIICLSHLGYGYDNQLAMNIPGIHIILGGHDHAFSTQPVPIPNPAGFNTLVCRAGSYYEYAGKMKFNYNNGNVTLTNYQLISLDSSIPHDDSVKEYLDSLKPAIIARYGNVFTSTVAFALNDITASYNQFTPERDTPLGNFVTDAHRNAARTQIALTAISLMSQPLYRGPVKGEDIFRVTPYGYDTANGLNMRLVTFGITGAELIRGLELVLYAAGLDAGYTPQCSGLKFDYNSLQPLGSKIIQSSVKVNDTTINLMSTYSVTANQGLYRAMVQLGIVVSNVQTTPINEYTSIYNQVKELRKVSYVSQGRIKDISVTKAGGPVANVGDYELYQNYPNPFNPVTSIKFTLRGPADVNLRIYDITGKEIENLISKNLQNGTYVTKWNASAHSSGIYFCRLSINGKFHSVKKMMLIK